MPPGGYLWWYLDGLSDDGGHALSIIAFVGSVFSPSYFRARRSELSPDPLRHCGINIALYGARDRRWVFTEPPSTSVRRSANHLVLGGTEIGWAGGELQVRFDERTAVLGRRVRGVVRLLSGRRCATRTPLGPGGVHHWWPIAPTARIEVELQQPGLRFSGSGYLDSNFGDAPLEHAFSRWTWSRASADANTTVLYDVTTRQGETRQHGLRFDDDGSVGVLTQRMQEQSLPPTRWRVARTTRVGRGGPARVIRTLEDTPFYARSLVELPLEGGPVAAIHESLDLERFCHPVVQRLLPFRIRRGWRA